MINFDKNATTSINEEVWNVMGKYAIEQYGNPSALYPFAEKSRKAIEESKETIAELIHCQPDEIYFVQSGTMADNWVIGSVCRKGSVILTTPIEHHAILNAAQSLDDYSGIRIITVPVGINGEIDINALEKHIEVADLVSVMYVNNEIGAVQDVDKIGHLCRKFHTPFHTDAVQAFGKIPIDVDSQCIDFMSVSGHKFHGPQGIGFLYIREKYKGLMKPLTYGGGQQRGLISGTENISGIVGLGYAAQKAYDELEENKKKLHELYWYLKSQLKLALPLITFSSDSPLENVLSVCFLNYHVWGEQLLAFLAENDICASTGSACASQSHEPSYVLKAIGLSDDAANSTLRLSFDSDNTIEEVDELIKVLTVGVTMISNT